MLLKTDPNKLSKYAALLYPELAAEREPENWLTLAIREDNEAKARGTPVQVADATGGAYSDGPPPILDAGEDGASQPARAPETVLSLNGNEYRTVWGPLSLGGENATGNSQTDGEPAIVRSEGEVAKRPQQKPELDGIGGSLTFEEAYTLRPIAMPENTKVDW